MKNPILFAAIATREKTGLTLQVIAEQTKISKRHLEAVENGEFRKLPGGVYATSYIRQYANAIGFDEFELLAVYHSETGAPQTLPEIAKVQNPSIRGFRPLFQ
jgi:cytoskeletal protein RodZ